MEKVAPPHDGQGDTGRQASWGLVGGFLLLAAGLSIVVFGFFETLTRYGMALVLLLAGVILLGAQALWLRKRQDRSLALWTALLDGILVVAVILAITPIIALVRGFADLVGQSKIQSGADWLAYGFAFTGLFLGAVFFAYAVKYYHSTVIVLITTIAFGRNNGNGKGNGKQHGGLKNGYHIDLGYHPLFSVHVADYEVIVVDDSTDDSKLILERWVNYGGTILVVTWLFVFWIFVQRFIFVAAPADEVEVLA
jgi:hypothetical protein